MDKMFELTTQRGLGMIVFADVVISIVFPSPPIQS